MDNEASFNSALVAELEATEQRLSLEQGHITQHHVVDDNYSRIATEMAEAMTDKYPYSLEHRQGLLTKTEIVISDAHKGLIKAAVEHHKRLQPKIEKVQKKKLIDSNQLIQSFNLSHFDIIDKVNLKSFFTDEFTTSPSFAEVEVEVTQEFQIFKDHLGSLTAKFLESNERILQSKYDSLCAKTFILKESYALARKAFKERFHADADTRLKDEIYKEFLNKIANKVLALYETEIQQLTFIPFSLISTTNTLSHTTTSDPVNQSSDTTSMTNSSTKRSTNPAESQNSPRADRQYITRDNTFTTSRDILRDNSRYNPRGRRNTINHPTDLPFEDVSHNFSGRGQKRSFANDPPRIPFTRASAYEPELQRRKQEFEEYNQLSRRGN